MHIFRAFLILFCLASIEPIHSKIKPAPNQSSVVKKTAKKSTYCQHTWYRCPQFYWQMAEAFTTGIVVGGLLMLCGAHNLGISPAIEYRECICPK